MTESAVASVATSNAVVPLPEPLQVGMERLTEREYSAVLVKTADGIAGKAYCLSRAAPMDALVNRLIAPHVIGIGPGDVPTAWEHLFRKTALVGRVGLLRRALGLIDIALWDIAAQRRGLPVWQLLGNDGLARPTMLVAAYPREGRRAADIADEVLARADDGWSQVKIAASSDPWLMRELLRRLADDLPRSCGLVVDAAFRWPNAEAALADIRAWRIPDISWLEDPLLPEQIDECALLRRESGVRIGVGDEVTDPDVIRRLIDAEAVDVVRVDVVALGGITPARALIREIKPTGMPISCHVYPEVTVHLGVGVETFLPGNPYDPCSLIVKDGPEIVDGRARPPTRPGLGFELEAGYFSATTRESQE